MTVTTAWIPLLLAWASGFAFAGIMDALWGFTEWTKYKVFLMTMIWAIFGCISIGLVIV